MICDLKKLKIRQNNLKIYHCLNLLIKKAMYTQFIKGLSFCFAFAFSLNIYAIVENTENDSSKKRELRNSDQINVKELLPGIEHLSSELLTELEREKEKKDSSYHPRTRHLDSDGQALFTNRLFLEKSPYLLQHAHNPINWYPWSEEAF